MMPITKKIGRGVKHLFFGKPKPSYGLNELDLKILPYLDFKKGIFIEAGANDGIKISNTLYLEKHKNWTGILIEPIPELAECCRKNRPLAIVENCALVPFDYDQSEIEITSCGLMSVVKGGMRSEAEEKEHIRLGAEIQELTPHQIKVKARTLSSVLETHAITRIDFLSLDVEGFELSVLKGIDFHRHKPTFILVEARYRAGIDAFLKPYYEPVSQFPPYDVLYRCLRP